MSKATDRNVNTGTNCRIADGVSLGIGGNGEDTLTIIGNNAHIRSGTRIYHSVKIGDNFTTGHDALVREETEIGDNVLLGTKTVIDGQTTVGSHANFQTGVYIPQQTTVGDHVFIGPNAVITNDPYPLRNKSTIESTTIADHASIGANATLLPGVHVGEGSIVAANAVVSHDVPPETLALGVPATHQPLPDDLSSTNQIV